MKYREKHMVPGLLILVLVCTLLVRYITSNTTPQPYSSAQTASPPIHVVYSPSNEDFPNPERGFMKQSSIFVDQPLDPTKIRALQPSDSVVWIYFNLEKYRDPRDGKGITVTNYQGKPLDPIGSGKGLDTVNAAFAEARKKGLKLVIRFLYVGYPSIGSTQDPNQTEPDAPIELVRQHLTQLTPLLQQNKDAIVAVQTGFVGYWGEWHSSKYLGSLTNRKAVTDALLLAVPKDRMLMLRYPRYKQLWYGGPISDSTAYTQTDASRIATHDDAFLKDDTDDGTFKSVTSGIKITSYCDNNPLGEAECWRTFMSADSRFTPVGGEASVPNSPRSDCPNALAQMEKLHWSFLNNGFNTAVLNSWTAGGCMDTIRRRLGYRLVLKEADIPQTIQPGGTLTFRFIIRNEGFGSLYNPRPVYAVLINGTNRYDIPLPAIDPRRWEAVRDHTVAVNIPIPAAVLPGTYKLGLWLPDATPSIRNSSAYAVRFANANVWDATTGQNILTANLAVRPGTASSPSCSRKSQGDADCNGTINLVDYDYYRRIVLGDRVPGGITADFNGDGEVGLLDGRIILQTMQIL